MNEKTPSKQKSNLQLCGIGFYDLKRNVPIKNNELYRGVLRKITKAWPKNETDKLKRIMRSSKNELLKDKKNKFKKYMGDIRFYL